MAHPVSSKVEECIVQNMVMRRHNYRKQFLKLKSDPCAHSKESGYVFDPALQRFMAMKACQFDHFQPTAKNFIYALCTIVIPMLGYGYLIHEERSKRENLIRSGQLKYKDRMFKFQ